MNKSENENITTQRIKELKGSESQEQFASKLHMSQSNISKILNGMPPSASVLTVLAKEYDVSVDWLLGLTDRRSRKSFPDRDNITYADVLAVFDKLMESNSIYENIVRNHVFVINDRALDYLLKSRVKARSVDISTCEFWYNKAAENFANVKIINWEKHIESFFEQLVPDNPEETDILSFLKKYNR